MLNKKLLIATVISSLALTACTGGKERWTDFSNQTINENVGEDAGIVFYRDNSGTANEAVNVIINGEYQASLQQKGYSEAIVCAQPQRLGAFLTGHDAAYAKKHNSGQYFNLQAGKVSYFKVSIDEASNVSLKEVDKATADQEMQAGKYQSHTLPRVDRSKTCGEHKYVLDASALFPFNKSAVATILPNGREEIKEIGSDIQRYPAKVSHIEVIGYTDPQGSASYNRQLSLQRAQAVKSLLVQSGVNAKIVQAKGLGAADLLVKDCAAQHNDAVSLNKCNQPNRRVEIKLHHAK